MVPNIPPEAARTLLSALIYRPDALTRADILAAFPTPPTEAELNRWLSELVAAGILQVDTSTRPHRYLTTEDTVDYYRRLPAATGTPFPPLPLVPTDSLSARNSAQPSSTPQPVTNNGGNAAPSFPTLFDSLVSQIVIGVYPFASALPFLQQQAQFALPVEQRAPFVQYALNRLAHLSLGECAAYGIEPPQHELWRRQYFPPAESAATPVAPPPAEKREEFERKPRTPPAEKPAEIAGEELNRRIEAIVGGKPLPKWAQALGADWLREKLDGMPLPVVITVVGLCSAAFGGVLKALTGNPWLAGGAAALILGGFYLQRRPENAKGGTLNAQAGGFRSGKREQADLPGSSALRSGERERADAAQRAARPPRWLIAFAPALLVALAGGIFWYQTVYQRPSNAAVSEYLTAAIAPLPMRVAILGVPSRVPGATGCRVNFEVRFETTEPLYRKIDTVPYLRSHFPQEVAAIAAANALLAGPNGGRIRELLVSDKSSAADAVSSGDPVLLTTSTPVGASATASGALLAWRRNGAWAFSGDPIRLDHPPVGEPKPEGNDVLVVDAAADLARLKALVTAQAAFAAQVQAAGKTVAAALEAARQQRIATFAQLLRPQTLFTGQVSGVSTTAGSAKIAFEITAAPADSTRLTAVLRNDGGWSDSRAFLGEWALSADAAVCTLTLRTTREDRIESGGPLLDDRSDWGLVVQLSPDGTATIDTSGQAAVRAPSGTTIRALRRVDPADAPAVRAEFSRAVLPSLAATKPGLLYRGTVTSRLRTATETLLLRFTAQEPDGSRVDATLLSPTNAGWTRPFRGGVIDNAYRGGSTPIRLQTLDADRVPQAPTWSMLAAATGGNGVAFNLRVDGTRLVGQDNTFSYVFEPTTEEKEKAEAGKSGNSGNAGTSGAAAPNNGSEAAPNNSGAPGAARPLPPFPGNPGAYVLSDDGQWTPLPKNNGQATKKTLVQRLNEMMEGLKRWEANIVGATPPKPEAVTSYVVFDGGTPVPVVSGDEVVVIYAGSLVRDPRVLERNPLLQFEPVMEVGPLWNQDNGMRAVPMISPEKGFYSFGSLRVPAFLDQPALGITLLRCKVPLASRHYALKCGDFYYELAVQ